MHASDCYEAGIADVELGDSYDRLPACQLIVLVLLTWHGGQGTARTGKRKARRRHDRPNEARQEKPAVQD